ncbi:hypothetical protein BGZ67_002098 [Mortierella alpina]|nr:hypothetical protein BGZ67_002098 [Mortierella alpina]
MIENASASSLSISDDQDRQTAETSNGLPQYSLGLVPSIDVEKVRAMLGQIQIDALPQGAKDLMRTMESQSRAMSLGMVNPGLALNSGTAPLPQLVTPLLNQSPAKNLALNSDMGSSTASMYVTKTELDQMEERIMNTIELRFKQLEERIVGIMEASVTKSHSE